MLEKRIIPALLLKDQGLVKTTEFKNPRYVGDPVNTVKIFNDKQADELMIMDIGKSVSNEAPDFELLQDLASEAFMPLSYGGGVKDCATMERLFKIGFEKVSLCSAILKNPELIKEASRNFGSQSVVATVNVGQSKIFKKPSIFGSDLKLSPLELAKKYQDEGAGEILFNFTYSDGVCQGYDLEFLKTATSQLTVPVIALGGAGKEEHLLEGLKSGADAVAAGSMFIYHGPHKAVLINYPDRTKIISILERARK